MHIVVILRFYYQVYSSTVQFIHHCIWGSYDVTIRRTIRWDNVVDMMVCFPIEIHMHWCTFVKHVNIVFIIISCLSLFACWLILIFGDLGTFGFYVADSKFLTYGDTDYFYYGSRCLRTSFACVVKKNQVKMNAMKACKHFKLPWIILWIC